MDDAVTRLLPRPALLKKRLAMTGKTWTVGQYGMVSLGITLVVGLLLWIKGMPLLLGLFLACSSGLACRISWSDRKSTRLNSVIMRISYAVFCLKKKKTM